MRLDKYLFLNQYAESREKAANYIKNGLVSVNGKNNIKSSYLVNEDDAIILNKPEEFVSRGALKLLKAIDSFNIDFNGKVVCDIGASTGGFTDVALKKGAKRVYAVDCGHGQLHPNLAEDHRVINIEGFNARYLSPDIIGEKCDIVLADVSFISQSLLYEGASSVLSDSGDFISLIKPQFEVGRSGIGKNGIVKNKKLFAEVFKKLIEKAELSDLYCHSIVESPISGGDGNTEFLAYFNKVFNKIDLESLERFYEK